jgi:hypothetical protein
MLVHCGPAFLNALRHASGDCGDSVLFEVQIHARKPKQHLVAASFVTLVDICDVTDWFYIVCDGLEIFPVRRVIEKVTELGGLIRQLLTLLLVLFGTDLSGNNVIAMNDGCLTRRGFQLYEPIERDRMSGPPGEIRHKVRQNRAAILLALNLLKDVTDAFMVIDPADRISHIFGNLHRLFVLSEVIEKHKLALN